MGENTVFKLIDPIKGLQHATDRDDGQYIKAGKRIEPQKGYEYHSQMSDVNSEAYRWGITAEGRVGS